MENQFFYFWEFNLYMFLIPIALRDHFLKLWIVKMKRMTIAKGE